MVELTQKQENFCLAYIETGNMSEAYRQAYDAENMLPESINRKAFDMMEKVKIRSRVEQLQAEHKERHDVTVDSLCSELEESRLKAMETGQCGSAVSATLGKAKLHGLGVEKRENKDTTEMTPERADEILKSAGMLSGESHESH